MSVVARFLVGWTALSVVVSPFIGMLLKRQQLDLAAVTATRAPRDLTPVPAR